MTAEMRSNGTLPSPQPQGRISILRVLSRRVVAGLLHFTLVKLPRGTRRQLHRWKGGGYLVILFVIFALLTYVYVQYGEGIETWLSGREFFAFNRSSLLISYSAAAGVIASRLNRRPRDARRADDDLVTYVANVLGECGYAMLMTVFLISFVGVVNRDIVNPNAANPIVLSAVSFVLGSSSTSLRDLLFRVLNFFTRGEGKLLKSGKRTTSANKTSKQRNRKGSEEEDDE